MYVHTISHLNEQDAECNQILTQNFYVEFASNSVPKSNIWTVLFRSVPVTAMWGALGYASCCPVTGLLVNIRRTRKAKEGYPLLSNYQKRKRAQLGDTDTRKAGVSRKDMGKLWLHQLGSKQWNLVRPRKVEASQWRLAYSGSSSNSSSCTWVQESELKTHLVQHSVGGVWRRTHSRWPVPVAKCTEAREGCGTSAVCLHICVVGEM